MSVLSAMVPPVAGVMIAAYWLINKGDRTKWQPTPGVNKLGVFSWLIGAAVGHSGDYEFLFQCPSIA